MNPFLEILLGAAVIVVGAGGVSLAVQTILWWLDRRELRKELERLGKGWEEPS